MPKSKQDRPKCAVSGCFKFGKLMGICVHVSVGEPAYCMAHGNKKCEHKIPIKVVQE